VRKSSGLIDVVAGLISRDDKLLITQRLPDAHLPGLWEFPGGKREPGEPWKQSLRRELFEELGIHVQVGRFLQSVVHHYPNKSVRIRFYACLWQKNEPVPLACQKLAWVDTCQLQDFAFPEADQKILRQLREKKVTLP